MSNPTTTTPAPATPTTPAQTLSSRHSRFLREFQAAMPDMQVTEFCPILKRPANLETVRSLAPLYGEPAELPPRRFRAGQQPRGTVSSAEAAQVLGITRGRLRAAAKSWGLIPFAYGPRGEVVYWAKHVERVRVGRAASDEVELQLAA